MPTRIIDLGSSRSIEKIVVRETDGLALGRYMTLSHCWGSGVSLVTTKDTLNKMEQGITLADLPQTFRDAALVTHALGIRYLWIDSLCIVQDDIEDWETEAGHMASVYSGSFLNLAATHSPDSDHGFLVDRNSTKEPSNSGEASTVAESSREDIDKRRDKMTCKPDGSSHEGKGILMTRAWVLQERLLAPRTIHFGSDEMFWECDRYPFECECGALGLRRDESWQRPKSRKTDLSYWRAAVEWYSRLDLTFPTDRLPALSGIAKRVQNEIRSEYLAGLWLIELPWALLWVTSSSKIPRSSNIRRAVPYRAPTWSWVSLERVDSCNNPSRRGVGVELIHSTGVGIDESFKIISANTQVIGVNPFGQVGGGSVVVEGKVYVPCRVTAAPKPVRPHPSEFAQYLLEFPKVIKILRSNLNDRHYLHSDFPLEQTSFNAQEIADIGLICIAIARKAWKDSNARALVVRATKEDPNKFERVGVMEIPRTIPDYWENTDIKRICIV